MHMDYTKQNFSIIILLLVIECHSISDIFNDI